MKKLVATLAIALAVLGPMAAPADAAIVYAKDGRSIEGALRVDPGGLAVTTDGKTVLVPYDQVAGVSLDGVPLFPPPRRLEESSLLNNEWLMWAVVAANVAAAVTAGIAVYRTTTGNPSPAL